MDNKRIIFTANSNLVSADPVTTRSPGSIGTLKGYALTWNTLSDDRGGYKVRLLPNSAKFTSVVHALFHHSHQGGPLGDTASGSLHFMAADDKGIPVEIDLPNTTLGKDVLELVRTGRLNGMSFSMLKTPEPQGSITTEDGVDIFNASDFLVDEVTVTAIPAFGSTTLEVKEPEEPKQPGKLSAANNAEVIKELNQQRLKLEKHKLSMYRLD